MSRAFMPHVATVTATATATVTDTAVDLHLDLIYQTPVVSTHHPLPSYPLQTTPVVSTHHPLPSYPLQTTPVVSTHHPIPSYPHPSLAAHKMASDPVTQSRVCWSLDTGQDSHFDTSSASMMSSAEVTAACGIPNSRYHPGNGNWYGTTDMGDNPYWQPDLLTSHGTSSEVYEQQYEGDVNSCFDSTSGFSGTRSLQGDRYRHNGHWASDPDPTCSSAYSGLQWQQEAVPQQHGGWPYYSPPGNDDTLPEQVGYSEYEQGHDADRFAVQQSLNPLCADSQNFLTLTGSQSSDVSLSAAHQANYPQNDNTFHAINPFHESAVYGPKWYETDIDEPQIPQTYTTATYHPAMVGSSEEKKCERVDVQPHEARSSSYQKEGLFIGKTPPKESSNEQHWGQPTCTLQKDRGVDTNCIRTTEASGADSFRSSGMPSFCSVSSSSGNRELFNHHQHEQMEMTDSDGQSLTQSSRTQHYSSDAQNGQTQHSSSETQTGCTQHFFSQTIDEQHQTMRSNDVSPGPLTTAISPAIHPNSQSLSSTDLPAGHTRLPVSELSGTPQQLSVPEPSCTPQHVSHPDTTHLSSDLTYPSRQHPIFSPDKSPQCVKGDEISSKLGSPVSSADSLSSLSSSAARESSLSSPAAQSLIDVDHLLSSGVTVAGFKPRPIIRKRTKVMIPTTHKDGSYWHKRKKNNDSAKRSREAKKEKEKNFYRRALELEYENYFLKERLGHMEAQLHAVTGGVSGPPPPLPPHPHPPPASLHPPLPSRPLLQAHSLPASHGHSGVVPGIVAASSTGEFGGGVTGGVANHAGPELAFN